MLMPLFYIHHTNCISPQQTFPDADLSVLHQPVNYKLQVIEPKYDGIPPGILRRMSKAVRIGAGAALPLLNKLPATDGIIIGTANAGMEDCFHFLKQIVDYEEGQLTPGNFVQSTPNAIAAQLSMISHNNGYNITHVHLGLAFENAAIDAGMMIKEQPEHNYLLGAVDDIATYNYTLNSLAGWFKKEAFTTDNLYELNTPGSLAGEAATMFLVNGNPFNAIAQLRALHTIHSTDEIIIGEQLKTFLEKHLPEGEKIDLLISGENGDSRLLKYYTTCENGLQENVMIVRFKHLCGEYPTAAAMALWLSCYILQENQIPQHLIKQQSADKAFKNILIYNNYKGAQHSFMLVSGMG